MSFSGTLSSAACTGFRGPAPSAIRAGLSGSSRQEPRCSGGDWDPGNMAAGSGANAASPRFSQVLGTWCLPRSGRRLRPSSFSTSACGGPSCKAVSLPPRAVCPAHPGSFVDSVAVGQGSVSEGLPFVPGARPAQGLTFPPDWRQSRRRHGAAFPEARRTVGGRHLWSLQPWPTGTQGDKITPQPPPCPE